MTRAAGPVGARGAGAARAGPAPVRLGVLLAAVTAGWGVAASAPTWARAQEPPGALPAPGPALPRLQPLHVTGLFSRVEREAHAALLAGDDGERDRRLAAAEQLARHLVERDSLSADAHYWLAVVQGIRTEHAGPWQKLTTGKEVFFTTARVLALDSLHAGGHEMMGRLHAAVMRLPWVVRSFALRMGMGEALGEASWDRAEFHYRRAAELDPGGVAPRLELAKLLLSRGRAAEARPVLAALAAIPPRSEVDRRMLDEARGILARTGAASPVVELPPA